MEGITGKEGIDLVVLWVDGNDPFFRKLYADFTHTDVVANTNRYREWGTLKYWFRAVEKYAPWARKIFFITNGQKPDFLNLNHPKLRFVSHDEYISREYLPTFNSNVIELNLLNLEDLSERFVLFNDDTFLNAMTKEEDFFVNGLPCDSAILDHIIPMGNKDVFYHAILNDVDIINHYYKKRKVIRQNFSAWWTPRYGKGLIRNACIAPWRHFSGFKDFHLPNSFLKSSFVNVYNMETEAFHTTWNNHFRGWNDISQHLIRYYQLCEGKFYPRKKNGIFCEIGKDTDKIVNTIKKNKIQMLCLNDNRENIDFEKNKSILLEAFEAKYPEKSSFEY